MHGGEGVSGAAAEDRPRRTSYCLHVRLGHNALPRAGGAAAHTRATFSYIAVTLFWKRHAGDIEQTPLKGIAVLFRHEECVRYPLCMRFRAASLSSLGVLMLISSASAAQVHPIWGPVGQPTSTPFAEEESPRPPSGGYWSQQPAPSSTYLGQRYDAMQERVCARVERRFAGDRVMLERIDRRLMKRFGFSCSSFSPTTQIVSRDDARLSVEPDYFGSVGDTVPRGATNVPMLSINLTASCDRPIMIDALTVTDRGLGLPSDIFAVWLSIDGERMTRAHTLFRDKTASLTFRRPLVIEACSTQTVDVVVAFAESSLTGGRHSFAIESMRGVSADASVSGSFPISGEMFEVGTPLSGRVTAEYKPITTPATFGSSEEQIIGRFSLTVDTTEEQTLHSMTFNNKGRTQDGDFVAIYLRARIGRTPFADRVQHTRDDYVTLHFEPPFTLDKGENIELDVIADIVSNTGSTVQMQFEEMFDLYSVGARYGYGENGQLYGSRVEILGTPAKVELR